MVARAEVQCCIASTPATARKWGKCVLPHEVDDCGFFSRLFASGADIHLMQFLNAHDLAKMTQANSVLRRLSLLCCAERLQFFLGLGQAQTEEERAILEDCPQKELESLPMVRHFLENSDSRRGGSLPRLLHIVSHCREQTYRTSLALGEAHTAVVTRSQTLMSSVAVFGEGSHGQLGNGSDNNSVLPFKIFVSDLELCLKDRSGCPIGHALTVACGAYHTAILTDCGRLITFGLNSAGQLGDLDREERESRNLPKVIPSRFMPGNHGNPVRYTQVVAGRYYTAAITECGRVALFGEGLDADLTRGFLLKNGDIDAHKGEKIIQLAAGQEHLIMRSNRNRVFAIGSGTKGKLGIAQNLRATPEEEALPETERALFAKLRLDSGCRVPRLVAFDNNENEHIVQVAAGGSHSALITADGHLYTWGGGSYGELGLGHFTRCVPKPTRVFLPKETPFALHVSCGRAHSAVLTTSGRIVTFGDGAHNQDGKRQRFFASNTPQPICLGELEAHKEVLSSVVCGGRHSATIDARGELFTFGDPLCTGRPIRRRSNTANNHIPKYVQMWSTTRQRRVYSA